MASFDPQTVLVVMALKEESGGLFESLAVQSLYTGIGQVSAAFSLTKALSLKKPSLILNLGTAGSFDLPQDQCVECSAFIQRKVNRIGPQAKQILAVKKWTDLPSVVCASADFIQNQRNEFTTDYQIMDMESYALAFVAKQFQIPFVALKYISDNSNENLVLDWKNNLQTAREKLFAVYQRLSSNTC